MEVLLNLKAQLSRAAGLLREADGNAILHSRCPKEVSNEPVL